MDFEVDIFELETGHIHVIPRSAAEGMIDFSDSTAFEKFIKRCQEYLKDELHAKRTMDLLIEQNHRFDEMKSSSFSDTAGESSNQET